MKSLTKELKLSLRKQSPESKQNLILKGTLKRSNTPTKAGKRAAPIAEVKTQDIPDLQTSSVNPVTLPSEESITNQPKTNNTMMFQNVLPAAEIEPSTLEVNPQNQTNQNQMMMAAPSGIPNPVTTLSPADKDKLLLELTNELQEVKARLAVSPLPTSQPQGIGGWINTIGGLISTVLQKVPLTDSETPSMTQTMASMWMQMAQSMMAKSMGIQVQINPAAVITGGSQ